jgi:hypothetical protein
MHTSGGWGIFIADAKNKFIGMVSPTKMKMPARPPRAGETSGGIPSLKIARLAPPKAGQSLLSRPNARPDGNRRVRW